jgi:hypothetical protein
MERDVTEDLRAKVKLLEWAIATLQPYDNTHLRRLSGARRKQWDVDARKVWEAEGMFGYANSDWFMDNNSRTQRCCLDGARKELENIRERLRVVEAHKSNPLIALAHQKAEELKKALSDLRKSMPPQEHLALRRADALPRVNFY